MSITDEIESALNRLAPKLGGQPGDIGNVRRLSGGASQETWAFELASGGATRRYILRRAPNGLSEARSNAGLTLAGEAALIQAAGASGVPIPPVAYVCEETDGLGEAFIMDFVDGETIARKLLREARYGAARSRLPADCGRALAGIHGIALDHLPPLETTDAAGQLDRYEELYRGYNIPRPVFDLAFQVLRTSLPEPLGPVLVHGDFRLGNLMVDETGLAAVLDWELAHIGDPREDLGWLCVNSWRFGQTEHRAGGFGALEAVLEAYAAAGGNAFAPSDIDWWEMLGSLKWGIMCLTMYDIFRSGSDPSVERAAIGRRVSETEVDLVALMEAQAAHA